MRTGLAAILAGYLLIAGPARAGNAEFEACAGKVENSAIRAVNCDLAIRLGGLPPERLAAAYYNRGRAQLAMRQPDKALGDFNEVLKVAPDTPEALVNRGLALRQLKQYAAAIADFDRVLALGYEPAAPTYMNRGMTYHQLGDKDRALADLRKAAALDPENSTIARALWETERFYQYQ